MTSDRLSRILRVGEGGDGHLEGLAGLCRACVSELGVTGAALAVVMAGENRGAFAVSEPWTAGVEELQFTLGEGPCFDAGAGETVVEPWLAGSARWPAFGPEAVAAGAAAVFAVPLMVGGARFGALDLYRDRPGPLGPGVLADAAVVAEKATLMVADALARPPPSRQSELLDLVVGPRVVVHQAAGMVSVQMEVSLAEALMTLRARSFAEGRPLAALAAEVVARRLRFDV